MKTISLSKNQETIVDDDQYDSLMKFAWHAKLDVSSKKSDKLRYYAEHSIYYYIDVNTYKWRHLKMQTVIWEHLHGKIPDGYIIDHINRNTLDNRVENLRLASSVKNAQNRSIKSDNTSGYKGVNKMDSSWRARIKVGSKRISLGLFSTPEEAAKAYNKAAIKHFSEFAVLNKIKDQ